jgi:rhamnopyranosyl-N-acetylglucosaminyl-diphospho-decaprenol beta-1,3/1,4-galactofuranosyltransferase
MSQNDASPTMATQDDAPRNSASQTVAKNVCAIIVTFNRLKLLTQCIDAIRGQEPRPDRIVVVDSGSTDGTGEWLAAQDDLTVVRQANCGSAGAYYTAFETALELGHEWIWCTDDDGIPEPGALAELIKQGEAHDMDLIGPAVVAPDNHEDLSFTPCGCKTLAELVPLAKDGVVLGAISLFNGTMIRRRTFEIIGTIKHEMFIWGDEYEFTLRARKAGLKDGTAVHALHVHPRNGRKVKRLAGGLLGKVEDMPDARAPHFFRNMGYIHANYERAAVIPRMITKYTLYYLMKGDLKRLKTFYGNYLPGLKDIYPEEQRRLPRRLPLLTPGGEAGEKKATSGEAA